MITILSAILGFVGSMVPDLLSIFRDFSDRKHELEVLKLQMKQQEAGHSQRLEEIVVQAGQAEVQAIYKTYNSGIHWVDALNATVRPVLAYAFFALYASVKCLEFVVLDASVELAAVMLWREEDQAVFTAIISFYFGQRAFRKLRK